jgi:hypothetical protein
MRECDAGISGTAKIFGFQPPHLEPEKKIHASLLEMLAKKLRGETVNFSVEALNKTSTLPNHKKGYH